MVGFLSFGANTYAGDNPQNGQPVKIGDTVEINYVGKLLDNTIFDSTQGSKTFEFEVGSVQVINGMSTAVIGMFVGNKKTVTILPEEAYGDYDPSLIITVPRDKLPADVKPGAQLVNPQGMMVIVKRVLEDKAELDGNYQLAGKTLVFDIELVGIK